MFPLLTLAACSGQRQTDPDVMNKLDARLQILYKSTVGQSPDHPNPALVPAGHNEQGEPLYSVIIRTEHAEHLRDAGLNLDSVIGSVVTARLTKSGILKAAQLESTKYIEADSDLNFPQSDV